MPRMSPKEIAEIIRKGADRLDFGVTNDALLTVQMLAQGLPHYAHLLGKNAVLIANEHGLRRISGKHVSEAIKKAVEDEIPSFSRHLSEFINNERGSVLKRTGSSRRFRYRFSNPLIQPYVIMRGLADGIVTEETLKRFRSR